MADWPEGKARRKQSARRGCPVSYQKVTYCLEKPSMARKPATEKKPAEKCACASLVEEREHLRRVLYDVLEARRQDGLELFRETDRRLEAERKLAQEKSETARMAAEALRWTRRAETAERDLRKAEEALYEIGATRHVQGYVPGAWKIPTKPAVKAARREVPWLDYAVVFGWVVFAVGVVSMAVLPLITGCFS